MDSLIGINSFVRAAEHLNFAAAGRSLGISPSAVGKNIARLEASLGVRLFQRTTRRVVLTDEGGQFHQRCRRILDDLQDAQAMMQQVAETPRGTLRVGLPTIGYRFLLPVLSEFHRRYPEIQLDLDFNDRLVDVIEENLDAVIRSGALSDSSLMSRRLGGFAFVLCASPDYLARRGTPQQTGDLARHGAIRYRFPTTGKLQEWAQGGEAIAVPPTVITCSNMEAVRAAAVAGLGIAFMPDFLARDELASGALVALLKGRTITPGQFSILWPSSKHLSPKLRAFVDFVSDRLF
ncbi:MAG: LysR family transcriptional regulator [Sphingobium sp.]|uniref:LysR family transcriptional regulator n=1 Tax=Sphingobium sp. TaxID=1912891 RepID=UPI0029B659C0|nr:LysR family transcriptional regulator [Sphingobium sp.]MDX3911628.1 LysR family transcriptional regulator [Sphingobium sp.]